MATNILVLGNGARAHATVWHLKESRRQGESIGELYCWPGNPGTAALATSLVVPTGYDEILNLAWQVKERNIGLTLVGQDETNENLARLFRVSKLPLFDPISQIPDIVHLRILKTSLLDLANTSLSQSSTAYEIEWHSHSAVAMALTGYLHPSDKTGHIVTGLKRARRVPGVVIFHNRIRRDSQHLFAVGRKALEVTAIGKTQEEASHRLHSAAQLIHFAGMNYHRLHARQQRA